MKRICKDISLILVIFSTCLLSGNVFSQPESGGQVIIHQDQWLDTLLDQYHQIRQFKMKTPDNKGIEGYRVQIFFDSGTYSGDRARQAKEDFETEYEEIPAYLTWKAPNYRVRVGDFRTRLEAEKFLSELSKEYPNAWIIKDEINFPEMDLNKNL